MNIYGVMIDGSHHDVSRTERGAKRYATKHGYNIVTIRYNCGCIAAQIAQKDGKKWKSIFTNI